MSISAEKIGALIPIRLTSERLPGKALLPIDGKPIVHYLLDRVFACRYLSPDRTIVCTTTDADDDALIPAVEGYGAKVFRGARDDIIRRFHDAMAAYGFEAVVQVDGDDPLSATEYMDATMAHLIAHPGLDIVTCEGLPLGTAVKSFTRAAMEKVFAHYRTRQNDTGFIYFFTKSGLCRHATIGPLDPSHVQTQARLTLDYPADFEVFTRILRALEAKGGPASHAEVVAFLNASPDVVAHNQHVEEDYWRRTAKKAGHLEFVDHAGETRIVAL
jgi:spore coat polysaccharide biosynthesis protein SpsF (cytidylyltransferase family)